MTTIDKQTTPKDEILTTMKQWLDETLGEAADFMLPELAQIFIDDSPSILAAIQTAIQSQSATALKESAHALKGSCLSMGLETLAGHCQFVEACSKNEEFELASARMPELQAEFKQVCALLQELV